MSGVQITGKIKPLNGGAFPVFEDTDGQGGYRCVDTIAQRNTFSAAPLFCKKGMLCFVSALQVMYSLNNDLTTWSFFAPSPKLANQAAWEVNASTGSDNNDGTPGNPLATTEELSRRLCNGFTTWQMAQNTTIAIAGSCGALDLNVEAPEPLTGLTLTINGAVTSVADTLTSVVNTTVGTQGRITVAAGPLTARGRIRSTSGANIGAVTYGEGALNSSTDSFVKSWYPNSDGLNSVNVANGTTVALDTLTTTIARPNIQIISHASAQITTTINDCIFPNGIVFGVPQGSNNFKLVGCAISGGRSTGNFRLVNCKVTNAQFNYLKYGVSGTTIFAGCLFNGTILVLAPIYINVSDAFDAATITVTAPGNVTLSGAGGISEWVNGAGLTAFSLGVGSYLNWQNPVPYIFGTAYSIGFALEPGVCIQTNSNLALAIGTTPLVLAGQNFSNTDAPISVGGASVFLTTDANAVSNTRTSLNLVPAARGNIAATNLFAAVPRKGLWRVEAYMTVTVGATLGVNGQVGLQYTDVSGVSQFKQILSSAKDMSSTGGQGGVIVIETDGATNPQYSVSGVTTQGSLQYGLRMAAVIESPG